MEQKTVQAIIIDLEEYKGACASRHVRQVKR